MILPRSLRLPTICRAAIAALICVFSGPIAHAANSDGTWNVDADGVWTTTTNWLDNTFADGSAFTANFTKEITANRAVTLSGAQTIGNLVFSNAGAAGSAWTITGNTLTLGDNGATVLSPTITTVTDATISSNFAGNDGFTKLGAGTLTINTATANSITGTMTVNAGKLHLDYTNSASNTAKVAATSVLALGGGTYQMTGKSSGFTSAATWAGLTINSGASSATSTKPGGATVGTNYNSITRFGIGGTVDFSGSGLHQTNGQANTNGIIGGYATFNGNTWVVGGTGFSNLTALASFSTNVMSADTQNVDVTSSFTATGNAANSVRFNNAGARTLTLQSGAATTITTGGILVTSAVGINASVITGGTSLAGAAGKDLIVHQNNTANTLTIASTIADNTTATGLTKSGAGTLIVTGANSYTGTTVVNSGTLAVNGSTSASSSVSVASGAVLGGTGTVNGNTTVSGSILGGDGTAASGMLAMSGSVALADGSIVELSLGAGGTHSSLAFNGAESFDPIGGNQAFHFRDFGATPGTYAGLITGVTVDPGTSGWTISNPGWVGTFTWNSVTQAIDLNLTSAPPEPTFVTVTTPVSRQVIQRGASNTANIASRGAIQGLCPTSWKPARW